MIGLPSLSQMDRASSTRIWLCVGPTDMRRGFDRLAEQARTVTRRDPQSGHLFAFRSRGGDQRNLGQSMNCRSALILTAMDKFKMCL